jgi:hypothetical protein
VSREPYHQHLPALELSIERATESVPDDGAFYLRRAGETIGRFRSLKAAQEAWREVVSTSGWQPGPRDTDPAEAIRRERAERWSRNRAG